MIRYEVIKKNQPGALKCRIYLDDELDSFLMNFGSHSPDGFQIGYSGSGPADLAYSILTHHFYEFRNYDIDEAKMWALRFYQQFKCHFVSPAKEKLSITDDIIEDWIKCILLESDK